MIFKDIDKIIEGDLLTLITNSVMEKKTLEYKQALPGNTDSDKKEFLADISSFANANGGDIIYGIIENRDTGLPAALEGVSAENIDQEITRLDSIIRDGIEPRISGIKIHPIKLSNGKVVVVIRIPKSWISPHRVTFKGHDKFYSRIQMESIPWMLRNYATLLLYQKVSQKELENSGQRESRK